MEIETSETTVTVSLPDLTAEGETHSCGGMDIRLMASRLPDSLTETGFSQSRRIELAAGREARLFVRVTQEDGHQAWSSPIYVTRT